MIDKKVLTETIYQGIVKGKSAIAIADDIVDNEAFIFLCASKKQSADARGAIDIIDHYIESLKCAKLIIELNEDIPPAGTKENA